MSVDAGRNLLLKKATDIIAGVRMLSIKFDATPIDVTSADSAGLITLLSGDAASKQLTIEVSGVQDSNFLRSLTLSGATDMLLTDISFTAPAMPAPGDVLTGDFYMTNYTMSGAHDGAVEFSATMVSSGPWTAA